MGSTGGAAAWHIFIFPVVFLILLADFPGGHLSAADNGTGLTLNTTMLTSGLTSHEIGGSSRREVQALISFKQSITGDPLHALKGWKPNDTNACAWLGVRCSPSSNNIVDLNLSSLQLVGIVPEMIGYLKYLERLDLSNNFLSGSIPNSIANCSSLSYLNMSYNQVSGEIPSQLGDLLRLQTLDVDSNNLTGLIPESIGNCSKLRYLDLSTNSLESSIPSDLSKLFQLTALYLYQNILLGSIPSGLGNCSSLVRLEVQDNPYLGGELPGELRQLTRMEIFRASSCNFVGNLPTWVTNFTSLVQLHLSDNSLSGEIPDKIDNMQKLQILSLYSNSFTGEIPKAVVNCTALTNLKLDGNQLTGDILPNIGLLGNLKKLSLAGNDLSGVIPPSFSNCSALQDLEIGENPMSKQTIPSWLASLASLDTIYFSEMNLYGEIPASLGQLTNVYFLVMNYNDLGGTIPESLGNLSYLQVLQFSTNKLQGEIPSAITGNLSSLVNIHLSNNLLVGSIPNLSSVNGLAVLNLGSNLLSGSIDTNIAAWCPQLQILHVGSNNFRGTLPNEIGNLTILEFLLLGVNNFRGSIPPSWGNLSSLVVLEVRLNSLEGVIPVDLTHCSQLQQLYLDTNRFRGSIPDAIGQLNNLRDLDLEQNFLSGTFPSSLANLTDMANLNLSNNGLHGSFPADALSNMASSLLSLKLSHNSISGSWPPGFTLLTNLQYLDISANNISGSMLPGLERCIGLAHLDVSLNNLTETLPQDLGFLKHLQFFNASFNNFEGPIPDKGFFQSSNITRNSFLGNPRLCGSTLLVSQPCPPPRGSYHHSCKGFKCRGIWIPVTVSISIFLLLGALVGYWWVFSGHKNRENDVQTIKFSLEGKINLSKEELMSIIHDQNSIIGTGAKSIVYKGVLPGREPFALKVLRTGVTLDWNEVKQSAMEELSREVNTLAQLRHVNIIKILGSCFAAGVTALILEYMPRGNLEDILHSDQEVCRLTYSERFKIILGITESLVYLHHSFHEPIIHRDLKPSNVLLGVDLNPKLSDFGISKFAKHGAMEGDFEASASTVCGTFGYMAPEYGTHSRISTKGDVYSYGIVLLELLTGKKPTFGENATGNGGLVEFVMESFQQRPLEILDSALKEEGMTNSITKLQLMLLLRVGLLSTRVSPSTRPNMSNILEMVKQIRDIGSEDVTLKTVEELAQEITIWEPDSRDESDSS